MSTWKHISLWSDAIGNNVNFCTIITNSAGQETKHTNQTYRNISQSSFERLSSVAASITIKTNWLLMPNTVRIGWSLSGFKHK